MDTFYQDWLKMRRHAVNLVCLMLALLALYKLTGKCFKFAIHSSQLGISHSD